MILAIQLGLTAFGTAAVSYAAWQARKTARSVNQTLASLDILAELLVRHPGISRDSVRPPRDSGEYETERPATRPPW